MMMVRINSAIFNLLRFSVICSTGAIDTILFPCDIPHTYISENLYILFD